MPPISVRIRKWHWSNSPDEDSDVVGGQYTTGAIGLRKDSDLGISSSLVENSYIFA